MNVTEIGQKTEERKPERTRNAFFCVATLPAAEMIRTFLFEKVDFQVEYTTLAVSWTPGPLIFDNLQVFGTASKLSETWKVRNLNNFQNLDNLHARAG